MSDTYTFIQKIDPSIFRAYDIRGIVGQSLTPNSVYTLGVAIGTEAAALGQDTIAVARDGRASGIELIAALKQGLLDSGRNVIDCGMLPTPALYFATHYLKTHSGVMLTGSHNPSDYNGLKMILNGNTLSEKAIQDLYERIVHKNVSLTQNTARGTESQCDIAQPYIERIVSDVKLAKPMKVVVDCGNGVASEVAPKLLKQLGCEVIELFCEIDGSFPNHHPDPSVEENLQDLIQKVRTEKADIGVAFDGDADRLGVITEQGEIIWADRQLMLFAQDVLSRNPGAEVIFDVKSTRHLGDVIKEAGGVPIMWKTGHSLLKAKMQERKAPLAGEMSGHIFFKERWYGFDDGIYAAARLLEILSKDQRSVSDVFKALPNSVNTPEIKVMLPEEEKFKFVQQLIEEGQFKNGTVLTIDGIRVDFADGWGLVRASNTTPCLTLRFESDTQEGLQRIKELFRKQMLKINPHLVLWS